ncbi:response regulator receiver protein [Mycobacterium sp. ACS1612]|uniref:GAF and ANTAR domain-containing protein n=1 Tax=Mycobacterium sp. ACS1612 TaxID=1834117 RepID=UPI0007FCB20D|nr:GAF and ANTAR domain-containing protein [Mycobacterium sp. ACS1612]OBF28909.1 response regulator receiver protein [Mycobacterium sp. ACS1612]
MGGDVHHRLARLLGDLAVDMQAQSGTADTLHTIVDAAAHIVPGARWAGISRIHARRVFAEVPTDPIVAKLDDLQSELGDGPCLTALREHQTVHIADMTTDLRWPQFAQQATELGVRSLLSFQLFVRSETLGALNLYAGEPDVFSDDSVDVGTILAQHAAVAMIGATAETNFQAALASRDVIGQAKGLLMHRDHLTGLQAFNLLAKASKETNIKLVDVARWLVEEHEDEMTGH